MDAKVSRRRSSVVPASRQFHNGLHCNGFRSAASVQRRRKTAGTPDRYSPTDQPRYRRMQLDMYELVVAHADDHDMLVCQSFAVRYH
jgi:hypothetical protein